MFPLIKLAKKLKVQEFVCNLKTGAPFPLIKLAKKLKGLSNWRVNSERFVSIN